MRYRVILSACLFLLSASPRAAAAGRESTLLIGGDYFPLIREYGYEAVKEANEKVSRYKKGSALRHIATTIRMLKR